MKQFLAVVLFLPVVFCATKREVGADVRIVKPQGMPGKGFGRVEVKHAGQWGTICDNNWDRNDAQVVCNELGFVKAIQQTRNAMYGQGTGKVWLENVQCKGNELKLTDCPHGGWGETGCSHARDAGVKCLQEGVPQILEVGCYRDVVAVGARALSDMYYNARDTGEIDWFNIRSLVTLCAEHAHARGYKYFGIQFFGECWGSKTGHLDFDIHGKGTNCYEGVGAQSHNFVYRFAPWKDLGCWHDVGSDRAMTLLENFRSSIDWFHLEVTVKKCYKAARKAGKKYFGIQFYGECWVGDGSSYQKHGYSTNCFKGVGRHWTNYVYQILW
ncbi:scavenger receptor cysteine-rich type 1 protein M130 [Exaiptasia diaphana]|uniref:SRCR domain-containing protein n=1 Tax=Exaiptasia diaphana TaxID=2652724 RepID=A0A913X6J5_EXADI|nr:scavenger receptor cysteine-rich type 1 protein M130 [Exaiptasia diaphana]XP_028514564.1 scavenger receptor cysteine-rich type 1 protein M130 [Exaiptasia diaphana]KXJ15080.1 Soluble scavenger receptor cysteine-rich domain-containing protein SSC5D [Exaiptasia diaphana]